MAGKFELKRAGNGQYHFNLRAGNGQVILSSEQYKSKSSAQTGILSVRTNAPVDSRYERKTTGGGNPYFVLRAGNGQTIGQSEVYSSSAALEKGIESVKKNAPEATVDDLT